MLYINAEIRTQWTAISFWRNTGDRKMEQCCLNQSAKLPCREDAEHFTFKAMHFRGWG